MEGQSQLNPDASPFIPSSLSLFTYNDSKRQAGETETEINYKSPGFLHELNWTKHLCRVILDERSFC